ncbi:MAG TPA: alpha-glucosidase [Micromonosporaceae bacterium]|nr:alpha-glucosidase [Micromonosporaceae bacterium]
MSWVDNAVIYQIYPRSFADGNGDGIGDVAGIRSRLPYLRSLGIDAVWLSPWYVSPMADAGYDVADYRDIDPIFGTLAEAEAFISEAHALGIRVIVDIVPNHCSDRHPLFQAALKAGRGSPERELFWFFDEPANEWDSHFGGPAWTQVEDGQWYLHMFDAGQPDWRWEHPRVREEFLTTLRFWLDRGVDGFRIDVADHLVKDLSVLDGWRNQDGVHEIYREWRKVADTYPQQPIFVGELWAEREEFLRYLRPDELHTGFNFPFLMCPWDATLMRDVIDSTLETHSHVGAPPTWVLSNHDVVRPVTRYGREDSGHAWIRPAEGWGADLALGRQRARTAALLSLALPGCAYVYQGEELGLPEVEDIPAAFLQDPRWLRSGNTDYGRDGCRIPLPWSGSEPPFGFSPNVVEPWLPQPASWASLTAEAQQNDPASMLTLYRDAILLRPSGDFSWLSLGDNVIAFTRGELTCLVNFGSEPIPLPPHKLVVLSSAPVTDTLPANTSAWLH